MGRELAGSQGKPSWAEARACALQEGEEIEQEQHHKRPAVSPGPAGEGSCREDKTQGVYLCPLISLTQGSPQPVENKQSLTSPPTLPASTILCAQPSQPRAKRRPFLPARASPRGHLWARPLHLASPSWAVIQGTISSAQTSLFKVLGPSLPFLAS